MKFTLRLENNFRPDERTLIHTGDYRVPEDMSEAMAQLAISAGAVVIKGAKETSDPASSGEPMRKRKGPAPENKARANAPENKDSLE